MSYFCPYGVYAHVYWVFLRTPPPKGGARPLRPSLDPPLVSNLQWPVDASQRPFQGFSSSAIRIHVNDCTSASLRPCDPAFGMTLRRRESTHVVVVLSHYKHSVALATNNWQSKT